MKRIPRHYDGTEPTGRPIQGLLEEMLMRLFDRLKDPSYLILEAWPQIAGKRIATMSQAVGFNEGILKVLVKNSTLLSLLSQHEKKGLIAEFKKRFPKVKFTDIFFRMG